ncbi:uncharacterized protein BDCG_06494 [Blastomyces dermatitidis ER-3]|uniref:Uncharacterized protein n=1 Tax=Ajellomyces dermatitidis (strain ER-3 / ATCC MYA-2586) TaxID=559297 RepID=A0ABP2F3B4_AJEDR|nr:uncharacterized protein BDCG_06494 [Blastomyces dermatitidis ER-3]EEQ91374.1 hypothetical protein BDCG_06494 [Blastomyces dermatitidis ER-3]EQL28528.1 hypothetical protein BDFG_08728 [Blastomyces dermatitidis ATCC 26199]
MTSDPEDTELKLEVDLMTLDYLVYKTIIAVVEDRVAQRNGEQAQSRHRTKNGDNLLGIFDGFMQIFRYNHLNNTSSDSSDSKDRNDRNNTDLNNNNANFPIHVKIKLQILTVTNLLCRRYTRGSRTFLPSEDALQAQRKQNKERAERWLLQNEDHKISCGDGSTRVMDDRSFLERNRRDMYLHMGIPCEDGDDNTPIVTLLDILPECISLCGMIYHHDIPDVSWMELPVRFMLFAAIEEILLQGKSITEAANEAFAWDYPYKFEGDDDDENFAQDYKAQVAQWESVRESVKASLLGADGDKGWESRIGEILEKCPFIRFEEYVMEWLAALLKFQNMPILVQLEDGKLEGLTLQETAALMDRVGIQ